MNFVFPDDCSEYVNAQIVQNKKNPDHYLNLSDSEYSAIKEFINDPKKIVDLGCGLGRMSVYMNHMLSSEAMYYLADSTNSIDSVKYGWNPEPAFYNDLSITEEFCKINGLDNFKVVDITKGELDELKDIDLVMSFMSVGFHYPIEGYINQLLNITSDNAIMIFGIRKGQYDISAFDYAFSESYIRENKIDVKEELLILRK